MKVSGVAETVEVQAETPLVDSKRRGTATTMTSDELSKIPNARDPWGVLRAVPGVMVDRVNIAGNENGQQATSSSKGQTSAENTWNLDGMVITDMSATGASPDVLRLRRVPGDHGHDRRNRPVDGDGRRRHQPHHAARHERLPRQRALHGRRREHVVRQHQRPDAGALHAERPRHRPAAAQRRRHLPRPGRPHQQHQGLRLRPRRPDHQGQALVLRQLRQAGHQAVAAHQHARRHAAAVLQRQAQLAGQLEHDGVGLLLPGQQAEVRPLAGQRLSRRKTASCGTRTTPTPTAGCRAASGSCRSTTPSRPTCSSR